ncbi:MAG: beta strand repeat-containing protein, partial [Candidatus Limnocylindria bacterium]
FTGFQTSASGALPNVTIDKAAGTLTLAGTLRTGRNWTYTAGTLDPGTSLLVFNGNLTITGDHTLNDVQLRSGNVTVAPGDTLTVGGTLTLTDGNLQGGTIAALGDISLAAAFDGETGTLRIAGTADQTFTGAANTTTSDMANVVIDKPSGTLFLVGTIRLLTSSWTWLQGAVDPGTSTLYFDTTVTISGTHSLYNVYLSGGPHTVTVGDTLTALGTLTLDNGTIDGGTIAAAGPLTQLSTFDGGSGLLRVVGTADQTFDGFATVGAGDLPAFEIDKPGGTLTLSGTIRTTNDWTHLSGTVDPDASLVVFSTDLIIDAAGMSFADVQVTSGTATLASDLIVGGDLYVSGGTLDAASMTVTVAGNVTIDGAFTPGTGLLVMNGVLPQILGGAAASIGLYDFTVNNAAGVTITTAVSVAGTLTLNGPLDISGQTLDIANAIAGTPTNLTGDPLSSLVVSGTGAGIVIPSSLPALANLTLDNPNGAALAGPITIGNLLTLTNGVLDAGAWVVIIDPAASVARTAGHVNGALQKTIPIGANMTATFEIGDATTYAPVSLLFGAVSGSGTVTAFTVPGEHPNIGSSVIDPARDVNRWWSLVNGGTVFDSMQATFTWQPADVDPGAQTSAFVVGKWDGAWLLPASGAALPTSITAFGMTSLSEFAVGEVESGDLPDTAQGGSIPPGTLLTTLLAALILLKVPAVPSQWARPWTAPVAASPRPEWETFWQDRFR